MRLLVGLLILSLHAASTMAADAHSLKVYSAGSLRAPLTEITAAYTATYGTAVEMVFGASGALGKRLAGGESADLFTSADRGNPELLASAGKAGPTISFARNHLCAVVRPGLKNAFVRRMRDWEIANHPRPEYSAGGTMAGI